MKIAITQLGCIGDLVLATASIQYIKDIYPKADIYFIVGRKNQTIVKNNPNIKYIVFDKNPVKFIQFLTKFLTKKFDFYIDPKDHFSNESAFIANIARANTKIGFNSKKKPNLFNFSVPNEADNLNKHFIQIIQNAIKPIYNNSKNKTINLQTNSTENTSNIKIYIDLEAKRKIETFLQMQNINKFILINISAGNNNKMWNNNKWIDLISYINAKTDMPILLSTDKPHRENGKLIAQKTNAILMPTAPLQYVIALIEKANLLISPDTSLVHIAATFDKKQIILAQNNPAQLAKFKPLSNNANVITPNNINQNVNDIDTKQIINAFNDVCLGLSK